MESLKDLDALPMVISVTKIDWLRVIFGFVQFFCIFKYLSDPDNLRDFIKSVKIAIYLLILFIVMMFFIDLLFCAIFVPFLPQPDETESSDDEDVLISDELHIILYRVICVPFITFSIFLIFAIEFPYKHVNHTKKINIFPLIMTFEKSVIGTEVRRSYKVTALKRITSLPRSLRDGVSKIRPGNANKFKEAHDNTLLEQMVNNMSVKMKSVGAIISNNFVIGTVFRVGSKYVMTALHVVKTITSLPRSHTDGVSPIRPGNANQFKKAHDNTLSEQMVNNMSVKMKSVGAIIENHTVIGTCFRVGSKYVMTALHVVKTITNPRQLSSIADDDWSKLDDSTVYIKFAASVLDDQSPKFYIKPDMIYMNKQLDIAVLELKSLEGLPRILKLSKYMGHVKYVNIIGFGHPTDPRKRLDPNCEVLNINHIITSIDNYFNAKPSVLQLNELELVGLKEEYFELGNTFMFPCHTFFEQGSSGAPASEENEVVGILVKGIPASYYRLRDSPDFTANGQPYFTASGIDKLPKNLMFELCIKTESIFNDMRAVVPMLAVDLFD